MDDLFTTSDGEVQAPTLPTEPQPGSAERLSLPPPVGIPTQSPPRSSSSAPLSGGFPTLALPLSENSPLRKWQVEHEQYLREKAQKSEERHQQALAVAKAELDNLQQERSRLIEKTHAANLEKQKGFLRERDAVLAGAGTNPWERVCKLVDLQTTRTEGKDISRFRHLLLELKHQ